MEDVHLKKVAGSQSSALKVRYIITENNTLGVENLADFCRKIQ